MNTTHTTTQHTPGPWYSDRFFDGRTYVTDALYNESKLFKGQVIASPTTCPEWEANARLIAAAPELLAALQAISRLRPYGDGMEDAKPDGEDAMRVLNFHIAAARAAIAKATNA